MERGIIVVQLIKAHLLPLLFTSAIIHLLSKKRRHGLWDIPGPFLAGYTRLWRMYDVWKGQAHMTAIQLHRKYGPLVRIGPSHVSVGDPKAIPTIYGLKSGFTKTAFYPIQSIMWHGKPQENLFSARDVQYHRGQRAQAASAYSMSSVLNLEPGVDSCSTLFLSQMHKFASSASSVDLGAWLEYYAFDVMGEVSFSTKLGFLEQGKDIESMIQLIGGILAYSSLIGQIPEMHRFLLGNPLIPILLPAMESFNGVLKFTLKVMETRVSATADGELEGETSKATRDMLSQWAGNKDGKSPKMSYRDLLVLCTGNVFAGADTTAVALRAVIYLLLRHPNKLARLICEIDGADQAGNLSTPITYQEATKHLHYLNAVLKESMRLHPSIGLVLERHVPDGGAEICGHHFPSGTIVGINPWVVHRDPQVFKDPESFIPERWIESPEAELKEMEQSFFAFGAGSRTCIGKNISIMEMSKIIPELLREFTIELAYPEREWKVKNVWFVKQEGLICTIQRRK